MLLREAAPMNLDAHRLYEPSFWANPSAPFELLARMRREDPVHMCRSEGYPDLWHVSRHADIFAVEQRTEDFLNEPRLIINSLAREEAIRARTGGSLNLIKALVTMDGSEHARMRLLTQAWFMPKNLARVQASVEESVAVAMRTMRSFGGACDFARDVAVEYPLRVIMSVLGVPAEDYPFMLRLTQELFGPDDPDTRRKDVNSTEDAAAALQKTFLEFASYFDQLSEARRRDPQGDLSSVIANAVVDGKPISRENALGYYIIVATAGHDTTSYSLTEAVRQLAREPTLYDRLRQDPVNVAPLVVEEAFRMAAPVRHFVRTAKHDTELSGQRIRAGDSLILWYPSGSRDESVFPNPDQFDIDRGTSPRHASFGHGAHMCLGMHLARQENAAFLVKLAREVERLELSGAELHMQATFVGGIKSLPIRARMSQKE